MSDLTMTWKGGVPVTVNGRTSDVSQGGAK